MGFLPGGNDATIRHNKQITHITQNNRRIKRNSTQNYKHNKGHIADTKEIGKNKIIR
jgi:hypothetical protein